MPPETWLGLVALLSGIVLGLTRVLVPRLAGLPFGLAGRSPWGVSLANGAGTAGAGVLLGLFTEPTWGLAAAGVSGALGLVRLALQLRVPRALAHALRYPPSGELTRIASEARPAEAERGTAAGQTWALWVLGTVEALQDAGVWDEEKDLLAMLDNYPLNPVLSALHRTMAAYFLLRVGDREKARWALSMDLQGSSEGLRARAEALTALLAAVEGEVGTAGDVLDRWMRPAGWSRRIRDMARANLLAAEGDDATRSALDHIELRWGARGLEEIERLDGPAARWLEP